MAGTFHYTVSNNFCNVEANTIAELEQKLADFVNSERISDLLGEFREATGSRPNVANPVKLVEQQLGGTVIAEVANAPQAVTGPEVVSDKYGNQYTYGLAEAPQLPDGRGNYVKKAWTSKAGKRLVAWVDPSKGPKPFAPGAVEAELIWI